MKWPNMAAPTLEQPVWNSWTLDAIYPERPMLRLFQEFRGTKEMPFLAAVHRPTTQGSSE